MSTEVFNIQNHEQLQIYTEFFKRFFYINLPTQYFLTSHIFKKNLVIALHI